MVSDIQDHQAKSARNHGKVFLQVAGPRFNEVYELCRTHSMTSMERLYNLYKTMQYVSEKKILGDVVECGVWQGGSMMMAAHGLLDVKDTSKKLILCDTFEGHPKIEEGIEIDIWGNDNAIRWKEKKINDVSSEWCKVDIEDVQKNIWSTGYPKENTRFLKGLVEDTLPSSEIDKISVLRLDVDWYLPTMHILETLYSKVSYGGVIIVDDYGHLQGARKAIDEFFSKIDDNIMFMHIDYSCVVAIKCPK